jgi:hypothetical protein
MNAFIVRPFNTKEGIDFERVEKELIHPALKELEIEGRTTGEIARSGNIRTDMFERLLLADIVVADMSIHNANVFYELGVRHALRDRRTFLIRCKGMPEVPFDLKTDRYLEYDKDEPGAALKQLVKGLQDTINSSLRDSPVFQLLPALDPPKREKLLLVPSDYGEEVERALKEKRAGDLGLLAAEARGFQWEAAALRIVGRAQYKLKAFEGARTSWEMVREFDPNDVEANVLLGTVYQRLNLLTLSDEALDRAIKAKDINSEQRAEVHALRGRNAKTHWLEAWSEKPESKQAEEALSSIFLTQAKDQYAFGFRENLNHFYSGLNALGLLTVITELSAKYPGVWELQFDSAEEAAQRLGELNVERKRLSATVESSLAACQEKTKRGGERDMWLEISLADFRCLTATNPPRVAQAYRQALAEGDAFAIDSVRAQLLIYQQLGVKGENAAAALAIAEFGTAKPETELLHVFLFTGHQIDSPDRPSPRFPADREPVARAKIKEVLEAELAVLKGQTLGIAGAASGGDILFLEVCAQVGITTDVYLALPANAFINESVASAGGNWVTRFRTLMAKQEEKAKQAKKELQPPLADKKKMPIWLQAKENYDIWQRNNLWMLHHALHRGGRNTTLIALWDGGGGDGPGGTKDMITQARALGARTILIDTRKEFGL